MCRTKDARRRRYEVTKWRQKILLVLNVVTQKTLVRTKTKLKNTQILKRFQYFICFVLKTNITIFYEFPDKVHTGETQFLLNENTHKFKIKYRFYLLAKSYIINLKIIGI